MKTPRFILERSFCDQLIIFLLLCFLLQALMSLIWGTEPVNQTFAFSFSTFIQGYIWTPITYGLIHDGPFHLIVNLIGIHFIGRPIESVLGRSRFRIFCLSCLILGLFAWLPFNSSPSQFIVGSSAIVLGSLCFFCLLRPNQPITLLLFFILPLTVKPKWVLWATLGLEIYGFVTSELVKIGGIAHSAHLGGMLCGLLFYLSVTNKLNFPFRFRFVSFSDRTTSRKQRSPASNFRVNFGHPYSIKEETDRILDKINANGFASLTDGEKETLEKAKKLLEK